MNKRGIFCLEGDWDNDLKNPRYVRSILELLSQKDAGHIPFIHRNVGTWTELE